MNDKWYLKLKYERGIAFLFIAIFIAFISCHISFPSDLSIQLYTTSVAVTSFGVILLLSLLTLLPGKFGKVIYIISMLIFFTAGVWRIASAELYREQGRMLLWREITWRFADENYRRFCLQVLFGKDLFLFALAFTGFAYLLNFLFSKFSTNKRGAIFFLLLIFLSFGGRVFDRSRNIFHEDLQIRFCKMASAPWSWIATTNANDYKPMQLISDEMIAYRTNLEPVWENKPAEFLSDLPGRYTGRNVVLIILESHRASLISAFNKNISPQNCASPELSKLTSEGLTFTNNIAPGYATGMALWSMFTGTPHPPWGMLASFTHPEAVKFGRVGEIVKLGYKVHGLRAAEWAQNWISMFHNFGGDPDIAEQHTKNLPRTYWSSWGMPDHQLIDIAIADYKKYSRAPYLQIVLTSTNHLPYNFPDVDGKTLSKDLVGGMRFQDFHAARYIKYLRSLPKDIRPVIMITADTSVTNGLVNLAPLGGRGLEGVRIPGLLLLPDNFLAGKKYSGTFSHEDLFDMLYMIVAEKPELDKFIKFRRRGVISLSASITVTETGFFDALFQKSYAQNNPWSLVESENDSSEIHETLTQQLRNMWTPVK